MDERSPYFDWRADEADERAELESEDYCSRCDRLVFSVTQMTCPACGDEPV